VLLEPRIDKFKTFLEPLLDAPGSKYSLIEDDPTALDTYTKMVAEGVFPHQKIRDPRDPKAQEPNNTLLVTGSLIWDPALPGLGFDSMAKQLSYHFGTAARGNELFHAYGLIRTLFWMQHEDFGSSMADSISTMYKNNRFMEMSLNYTVIVNGHQTARKLGKGSSGREPQYAIESTIRALRRGREQGMELPPHRRDYIHEFADDIERITNGTGVTKSAEIQEYLHDQQLAGKVTTGLLSEGLIEHYEAEKTLRQKYPDIEIPKGTAIQEAKVRKRVIPEDHPGKDKLRKYFSDCAPVNFTQRLKTQIEAIADIGEAIYNLECKILCMKDGPEKDAAMAKLEELNVSWEESVKKLPHNYTRAPATELDDRLALRAPPAPRIQWDSRPHEPLTMRSNEAWPTNRLSLVSTEPVPQPTAQFPDYYEWLQDFLHGLYANPSDDIAEALDKMQHGLRDIMEECPSLKDPKKGGRLQMKHFRVRLLTPEMITELLDAYKNWPFKAPGSDHPMFFRHKNSARLFASKTTSMV
jgi:transcription factor 1